MRGFAESFFVRDGPRLSRDAGCVEGNLRDEGAPSYQRRGARRKSAGGRGEGGEVGKVSKGFEAMPVASV